jgi:hypothetical protein
MVTTHLTLTLRTRLLHVGALFASVALGTNAAGASGVLLEEPHDVGLGSGRIVQPWKRPRVGMSTNSSGAVPPASTATRRASSKSWTATAVIHTAGVLGAGETGHAVAV